MNNLHPPRPFLYLNRVAKLFTLLMLFSALARAGELPLYVYNETKRQAWKAEIRNPFFSWQSPSVDYNFDFRDKPKSTFKLPKEIQQQIAQVRNSDFSRLYPVVRTNGGWSYGPITSIGLVYAESGAIEVNAVIGVERLGPKVASASGPVSIYFVNQEYLVPLSQLGDPVTRDALGDMKLLALIGGDAEYPVHLINTFVEPSDFTHRLMANVVANTDATALVASRATEADVPIYEFPLGVLTRVSDRTFNELGSIGPEDFTDMHTGESLGRRVVKSVRIGTSTQELVAELRTRVPSCRTVVAESK